MERIGQKNVLVSHSTEDRQESTETFKPTGAVAFFVLLVILSIATWFGIYLLMLHRI